MQDDPYAKGIDWEALWLAAEGPVLHGDDLVLVANLFETVDKDKDGRLQPAEFSLFRGVLAATSAQWLFDVDDGGEGESTWQEVVDPAEWVSFHVAAVSAFGRTKWRPALERISAVCRVTRIDVPVEESWVVCMGTGGDIMSSWFSTTEMQASERAACFALRDAGGWRCMSCEAEAFEVTQVELTRSSSLCDQHASDGTARYASDVVEATSVGRRATAMAVPAVLPLDRAKTETTAPTPYPTKLKFAPTKDGGAVSHRCNSLGQMLAHRAMRPLRKRIQVNDMVIIEALQGTARDSDVGEFGRVKEIYIPEHAIVKQEWCKVVRVEGTELHPEYEVMVPLRVCCNLKVEIRPGDKVQAHRPVAGGRRRGDRSREVYNATVLGIGRRKHLLQVSFGPHDEATVPLSFVLRLEMSAWTQVLRQAPRSTLFFLICDLGLMPHSQEDRRELDDRMRRDFEPHGRCKFVGTFCEEATDPGSPGSAPVRTKSFHRLATSASMSTSAKSRSFMGVGDCGKVLSFNCDNMEAVVTPDRKKHLRIRVALNELEPDHNPLPLAATCGTTRLHAFPDDPPLVDAFKQSEAKTARKLLSAVRSKEEFETLLEGSTDADGNTLFHAAAFTRSDEMWRILWGAVMANGAEDEAHQALLSVNDWGRSPLWVALEGGDSNLVRKLLDCHADVNQEAPVLFGEDGARGVAGVLRSTHDFCGGPGMVEADAEFEIRLFTPICGLKFGPGEQNDDGPSYVVVRSYGDAASQCVMPGDVLLSINGQLASACATFRSLQARIDSAPRPLVLVFRKGDGLRIHPLHRACELGMHEIVDLLLRRGAEMSVRDVCGRSAMDRAVRLKHRQKETSRREAFQACIDTLVEHGASEEGRVCVLDADGKEHLFEAPAHWTLCREMTLEGRFWLNIVDETSGEVLEHLQRVVDKSIGSGYYSKKSSKDRRGVPVPDKMTVEHVQRIENVASLREYLQRRHIMKQAHSRSHYRVEPVDDLKCKVHYPSLAGADVASPLDGELNEVYLFHGTSPESAAGIAREDFLLELAGSCHGDAFGRGIYFAEDCLKSDEYSKEAAANHRFAGLHPILLCRVLLGRLVTSQEQDISWEVSEVMRGRYESLCADRKSAVGTFREFVIFDEDQANAEYILWYRRHI